jgi:hypothetical protein
LGRRAAIKNFLRFSQINLIAAGVLWIGDYF